MMGKKRWLVYFSSSLAIALTLLVLLLAQAETIGRLSRISAASDGDRDSSQPSLSADGTKIAFHSDSDFFGQGIPGILKGGPGLAARPEDVIRGGGPVGQFEIWLYDTTTMTVTRITTASNDKRDSFAPSLSADGTKVAFHSDSDFLGQGILTDQLEIWLYDTSTMTVTRITTASASGDRDSTYPDLSANGAKIAFLSDADFLNQGIGDDQFEVWLYDTATMTITRITSITDSNRTNSAPSLSADGTKIAFHSDTDFLGQGIADDQFEVWLYDTTTMTLTRITTASDGNRDSFSPSLDGNGTKIAFWSNSDFLGQGIPGSQFEIWLYDTTTMTVTRITAASDSNRGSARPRLSADGIKIAFHSDSDFLGQGIADDQSEIWLYDTATMTVTRLTTALGDGHRDSVFPTLNADGTRVAFESDADFLGQGVADDQSEIWLYTILEVTSQHYLPLISKN